MKSSKWDAKNACTRTIVVFAVLSCSTWNGWLSDDKPLRSCRADIWENIFSKHLIRMENAVRRRSHRADRRRLLCCYCCCGGISSSGKWHLPKCMTKFNGNACCLADWLLYIFLLRGMEKSKRRKLRKYHHSKSQRVSLSQSLARPMEWHHRKSMQCRKFQV